MAGAAALAAAASPMGGGGLGIGAHRRARPRSAGRSASIRALLIGGAEILTGGGQPQLQQPSRPHARRRSATICRASCAGARQHRGAVEGHLPEGRPDLSRAEARDVLGPDAVGLWRWRRARWGRSIARTTREVYLDTSFFNELERRFRGCSGKACQFAQAYVIAHEVGHHVQNLLGILPKAQEAQQAAGSKAESQPHAGARSSCRPTASPASGRTTPTSAGKLPSSRATSRPRCRPRRRSATTRCSGRAQGYVVPDSFTHGSAEQRKRWFMTGFREQARVTGLQHVRGEAQPHSSRFEPDACPASTTSVDDSFR